MPFATTPFTPVVKNPGDLAKSQEWNEAMAEVVRLENDKVNKAGDTVTGSLNVSGQVGIGTNSPNRKLHVVGNRIRLENSGRVLEMRADGSEVDLQTTTNHLYIRSNNNIVMNPAASEGNIGIGTNNPSAKLHVNGDFLLGQNSSLLHRIVAGRIQSNGQVDVGNGFTSTKTGTGSYTITFSTPFSNPPIVIATCNDFADDNTISATAENGQIRVRIFDNDTHSLEDGKFSFIAIGVS